jgi:hypothetical protein
MRACGTPQAADQLAPGSPLAGEALFVTNQEPVPFWDFTGDMLQVRWCRRCGGVCARACVRVRVRARVWALRHTPHRRGLLC